MVWYLVKLRDNFTLPDATLLMFFGFF